MMDSSINSLNSLIDSLPPRASRLKVCRWSLGLVTCLLVACGSESPEFVDSPLPTTSTTSPTPIPSIEAAPTPADFPTPTPTPIPEEDKAESPPLIPEGWVGYTAPDQSFAIAFPKEPDAQTIPNISAKYDGGSRFYFARVDYPDPPKQRPSQTEVREYLELAMPGLARAFGGDRIDYWEALRLGGHDGRRMVFKNERGIQFETRFFFDAGQGRLFVATFGLTDENIAVPDAQKFFESFRIGDRP